MKQKDATARFKKDLSVFVTALGGNVDQTARDMAVIMAKNIIVGDRYSPGTPVDTGFARSSWYPAMDGSEVSSPGALDKTGTGAIANTIAAFQSGRAGMTFELWTNTTYMPPLEHGTSKQAPRGMVRLTMRAGQQIAEQAVREGRRRSRG